MKPLTRRQQEFLSKFLDLYNKEDEPIHYSTLADHIGVGKVTAYEMLRLLEDRGLVEVEYYRPEDQSGPGRASVVFRPTHLAESTLTELAGSDWNEEEWEQAKARILEELKAGRAGGYEILMDEILERLDKRRSPILYLSEMVTASILGLYSVKDEADVRGLRAILRDIGLPGEIGLGALAGLSAGLSLVEHANRRVASVLLRHVHRYQQTLSDLSVENRRRLAEFTKDVLEIVDS